MHKPQLTRHSRTQDAGFLKGKFDILYKATKLSEAIGGQLTYSWFKYLRSSLLCGSQEELVDARVVKESLWR